MDGRKSVGLVLRDGGFNIPYLERSNISESSSRVLRGILYLLERSAEKLRTPSFHRCKPLVQESQGLPLPFA